MVKGKRYSVWVKGSDSEHMDVHRPRCVEDGSEHVREDSYLGDESEGERA